MKVLKALPESSKTFISGLSKIYFLESGDYAINNGEELISVEIKDESRKYDAKAAINFENNDMEAYLTIYPALGGKKLSLDELKQAADEAGIRINLSEKMLEYAASQHDKDFFVDHLLIATGIYPVKGKDAIVIFNFSGLNKKPKINADGKVDYKNIDNVIQANKSDVLIVKRPATPGIKGLTLKNTEIPAIKGKDVEIIASSGVALNPIGTNYIAQRDGYVEFDGKSISVHEVFYVKGNVDFSTGNIRFNGAVHVEGDVLSGFRIEATKDVVVDGVCNDCEIISKKNIFLRLGVKGGDSNLFKADGNITVGYCESGRLYAKQNIYVKKYAYNSELYAGGEIDVTSGEGIVAGGSVKAFQELRVKQLGTQGNSRFTISMGSKYFIDNLLEKIRIEKIKIDKKYEIIAASLESYNLSKPEVMNDNDVKELIKIQKKLKDMKDEMTDKEEELRGFVAQKAKIKVKEKVYAGLTVFFNDSSTIVREQIENVVFYKDEKYGEVAWVSLKDAGNIEF